MLSYVPDRADSSQQTSQVLPFLDHTEVASYGATYSADRSRCLDAQNELVGRDLCYNVQHILDEYVAARCVVDLSFVTDLESFTAFTSKFGR